MTTIARCEVGSIGCLIRELRSASTLQRNLVVRHLRRSLGLEARGASAATAYARLEMPYRNPLP
jgi:hypothetical protein